MINETGFFLFKLIVEIKRVHLKKKYVSNDKYITDEQW